LYQNIDIIRRHAPDNVIVLGGDHIYTMDYSKMLYVHAASGADLTVGCIEVPREEASEFGVMSVDEDYRITEFTEKPENPHAMPGKSDKALASMGIYIFSTAYLYASLISDAEDKDSAHDFGRPTGVMWVRLILTGWPTWNCVKLNLNSICIHAAGRSGLTRPSTHRPNLYLMIRMCAGRPLIRWFPVVA
jgi:hypothetical protein